MTEQPRVVPEIKMGPFDGRERWYRTTHHIDELKRIAETLVNGDGFRPGVKAMNFHIWYEPDYHFLEFDLDGNRYKIRYYKVFTVIKNGIDHSTWTKGFHTHTHYVEDFFLGGRAWAKLSEWEVPPSMDEANRISREETEKWLVEHRAKEAARKKEAEDHLHGIGGLGKDFRPY